MSATVSTPGEPAPMPATSIIERSRPMAITEVSAAECERIVIGIEPLDRVLGGGLVPASVVLISGEPGSGKSSIIGQAAARLAALGMSILYATGEESPGQVRLRAERLDALHARIAIVAETDVDVILEHAAAYASNLVLVVDSIQTCKTSEMSSIHGSVGQIKECTARLAAFAKARGVPTIIIGHVTKDGNAAGPKTLEHLVDVTISIAAGDAEIGLAHVRFLSTQKNRFGSTMETGALEMTSKGLVPCDVEPRETPAERDAAFAPLAQELLNRYIAGGGNVDAGLADRIAGRLDMDMWRETRHESGEVRGSDQSAES
jgi:DNA repair protein RadA/Sms